MHSLDCKDSVPCRPSSIHLPSRTAAVYLGALSCLQCFTCCTLRTSFVL